MTSATVAAQEVIARAASSTASLAGATRMTRASWLDAIARAVDEDAEALAALADEETHLGTKRLEGEVRRTTGQLRMFADVIREGSYLEAMHDPARPDAVPPRPDLRRMLRPIGMVGVFAASNFPFAFSVAGGDTASALAAGCPVVVKAHSGHVRTSQRVAQIVTEVLEAAGAPSGSFGLIEGREAGLALCAAPQTAAVAFTGSVAGGRALMAAIAARPDPIPFFGELGSINPVVITRAAVAARAQELAVGLVDSFTLGRGQFCTKPGLVFVPRGRAEDFDDALNATIARIAAGPLLTDRVEDAFRAGAERLLQTDGVVRVAGGQSASGGDTSPLVVRASAEAFRQGTSVLTEECFGPVVVIVEYDDHELVDLLTRLPGSLTATVHRQPGEPVDDIVAILADRAGRLLFDGWPTGVTVNWAQHHGGPWPATTTSHTSVGATAIRRFLRPIVFQNAPAAVLPAELTDAGLAAIPHRHDGGIQLPRLTAEREVDHAG